MPTRCSPRRARSSSGKTSSSVMAVRKPRPPRFHGEQRDLASADGARGREQRAIAAQHDHQVAADGDFRALEGFSSAGVRGRLLVAADGQVALLQPSHELRYQFRCRRHLRLRKYSDCFNAGHKAKIPCSLPRPGWGSRSCLSGSPCSEHPIRCAGKPPRAIPDRARFRPCPPALFPLRTVA
jgi:hypothetical protein